MRRLGWLLIVLVAILEFGCAPRGDWISETLTLVDVSGTWEGMIRTKGAGVGQVATSIRLVLRQSGARVTGVAENGGGFLGFGGRNVNGHVNGDVFTFQVATFRGEATIDGVEMSGQGLGGQGSGVVSPCPCSIVLRRVGKGGTSAKRPRAAAAGVSCWRIQPVFVPKVCPTRDHSRSFWSIPGYDDQLKLIFEGKHLRALPRVMF